MKFIRTETYQIDLTAEQIQTFMHDNGCSEKSAIEALTEYLASKRTANIIKILNLQTNRHLGEESNLVNVVDLDKLDWFAKYADKAGK